jgi:hypothetical protein
MELEPATNFTLRPDRRPRVPEPLPVKLVAIKDVRLPAPAGVEVRLDAFYVGMLGFERDADLEQLVYHAENFSIRFHVIEPPAGPHDMRSIGVEVRSLADAEHLLDKEEIEYVRQRGVMSGMRSLLLLDPAGNRIELVESTPV